jgi:hypothetical protein
MRNVTQRKNTKRPAASNSDENSDEFSSSDDSSDGSMDEDEDVNVSNADVVNGRGELGSSQLLIRH